MLAATGCASNEEPDSSIDAQQETEGNGQEAGVQLDDTLYQAAVEKARELTGGEPLGGSISYLGQNTGGEGAIIEAVFSAFEEGAGVQVNYEGTSDLTSILRSRVEAGNPPDIADDQIGSMLAYAADHDVMNLSDVVGEDYLREHYAESLLDRMTVDGEVKAVVQGISNFMVWYNPQVYQGPTDSGSWQDLVDYADSVASGGEHAAWCQAQNAGASSGFPGGQFITQLLLKKYGPEVLDSWGRGELAWSSPEVKDAFEMFGATVIPDGMTDGGVAASLATGIGESGYGLLSDPPTCELMLWGTWTAGLTLPSFPEAEAGTDLDFFSVPASDPAYADAEQYQATAVFAFTDTEATRAFMQYVASVESQTLLASANQWTVANQGVPTDTYPNPLLTKAADELLSDDIVLAAGPNLLGAPSVTAQFNAAVVEYLQNPDSLDSILTGMDQTVADAR